MKAHHPKIYLIYHAHPTHLSSPAPRPGSDALEDVAKATADAEAARAQAAEETRKAEEEKRKAEEAQTSVF